MNLFKKIFKKPKVVMRCFLCVWLASILCSILLQFAQADTTPPTPPADCAECRSKKQEPQVAGDTTDSISNVLKAKPAAAKDAVPPRRLTVSIKKAYYEGERLISGPMHSTPPCADLSLKCDEFALGKSCKSFLNKLYEADAGTLGVSNPMGVGDASPIAEAKKKNVTTALSSAEPGAKLELVITPIAKGEKDKYTHADALGALELPQAFLKRIHPDGNFPLYIDAAIDLKVDKKSGKATGGILLYTSKDSQGCYHGDYLSL